MPTDVAYSGEALYQTQCAYNGVPNLHAGVQVSERTCAELTEQPSGHPSMARYYFSINRLPHIRLGRGASPSPEPIALVAEEARRSGLDIVELAAPAD